jgi:hypothetical protein
MDFKIIKTVQNLTGRRFGNLFLSFTGNISKEDNRMTLVLLFNWDTDTFLESQWYLNDFGPIWVSDLENGYFFYGDDDRKTHRLSINDSQINEIVKDGSILSHWRGTDTFIVMRRDLKKCEIWDSVKNEILADLYKVHDHMFFCHIDEQRSIWSSREQLDNFKEYRIGLYYYTKDAFLWLIDVRKVVGFYRNIHTNAKEDFEILNIIAAVLGILWVDLAFGAILGLDIETGEVKYLFNMPTPKSSDFIENDYVHLHGYNHTVYDADTNKLIGINRWHYYEIDLNKDIISLDLRLYKEDSINLKVVASHPNRRCMDSTHIYFNDVENHKIAALNRESLKIDWVYKFDGSEASRLGNLCEIEKKGDKLYVFDHLGNLFIFKKEIQE